MAKIINSKFLKVNVVTTLLCLVPLFIGAVFYSQLPNTIPIHFNMQNQPDNYSSKPFALFGIPLFLILLHVVCCIGTELDPRHKNTPLQLQYIMRFIIPIIGILVQSLVILYVLNDGIDISKVIVIFLGVIFLLIGNYLPKCKSNYTFGIRLPWTLADDDNWNKTHRMAGILWVLLSILMIISGVAGYVEFVFLFMILAVGIPCIYSYLYSKNRRNLL